MFIIDDENSDALPLPKTYGVDDIPVIVQDRLFDNLGRLVYSIEGAEDGMLGDTITTNGIANASRRVPAGLVRLRLLNGANARYFRFRFSDNREFHKIATDGGFLEEPVPIREILMAPGERNKENAEPGSQQNDKGHDGLLHYKYIPKTGDWGQSDVEYPVLSSASGSNTRILKNLNGDGVLKWHKARWEDLPTRYNIVNTLAELDVLEYTQASLAYTVGSDSLRGQRILT